jgi:hypothetical protein
MALRLARPSRQHWASAYCRWLRPGSGPAGKPDSILPMRTFTRMSRSTHLAKSTRWRSGRYSAQFVAGIVPERDEEWRSGETVTDGDGRGSRPGGDVELGQNACDMIAHGASAHIERVGDLLV